MPPPCAVPVDACSTRPRDVGKDGHVTSESHRTTSGIHVCSPGVCRCKDAPFHTTCWFLSRRKLLVFWPTAINMALNGKAEKAFRCRNPLW